MNEYLTDKKANTAYWDDIDDIVSDAVQEVAKKSEKPISKGQIDLYLTDITSEAREVIIKQLELIGGEFPYVDEFF